MHNMNILRTKAQVRPMMRHEHGIQRGKDFPDTKLSRLAVQHLMHKPTGLFNMTLVGGMCIASLQAQHCCRPPGPGGGLGHSAVAFCLSWKDSQVMSACMTAQIVRGANGDLQAEDLIPNRISLIVFSSRGYIKRMTPDHFSVQVAFFSNPAQLLMTTVAETCLNMHEIIAPMFALQSGFRSLILDGPL